MDIRKFMIPEIKETKEEILTFKGIDRMKDEDGKPLPLKFRKMSRKEYRELKEKFTKRTPVLDKRGNFVVSGDKRVFDEEIDAGEFNDELIIKCMVEPDLHSKELLDFYGVRAASELLNLLFKGDDYTYVDRCCSQALGFTDLDSDKIIKDLKN